MRDLHVEDKKTFEDWLAAEKVCLLSLKREPVEETLSMEYYQKLVNLDIQTYVFIAWAEGILLTTHRIRLATVRTITIPAMPDPSATNYESDATATRRLEAQRRHAMELYEKILISVQELEARLGIHPRWLPGSEEWNEAAILVGRRRYQRALDQLQGLIIARIFELTKMNMSGTGAFSFLLNVCLLMFTSKVISFENTSPRHFKHAQAL